MATEEPRLPRIWTTDDNLVNEVKSCPETNRFGTFTTKDGKMMQVYCVYNRPLTGQFDATDSAMHALGFTDFFRFVAVGMNDALPYAVWEIYGKKDGELRSKAIDVDANNKGKWIGSGMRKAIEAVGGSSIQPSGSATEEGMKFIASWKKISPFRRWLRSFLRFIKTRTK